MQSAASIPELTRDFTPALAARFHVYKSLLQKWQPVVNLVSSGSLSEFEHRHLKDSAQLYPYLSETRGVIADLGSGAGLPGMVLAMMGIATMELIESDARKCAFLQTVARETGTEVAIRNQRIETLPQQFCQAVTARACAPLTHLLSLAHPLLAEGGFCLFLKGRNYEKEIGEAKEKWRFDMTLYPSQTASDSQILEIRALAPIDRKAG